MVLRGFLTRRKLGILWIDVGVLGFVFYSIQWRREEVKAGGAFRKTGENIKKLFKTKGIKQR
jgi:hypothetical protein